MQTKSWGLSKINMLYKIYKLRVENLSHELQGRNLCHERIFTLEIYKALAEVATGGVL